MQVQGTPLYSAEKPDAVDFVRVIAVARWLMPKAHVRLSAGRSGMSDETQALCFLAGANSISYGDKLLTTENPEEDQDRKLFAKLGITPEPVAEQAPAAACGRPEAGAPVNHLSSADA